MCGELPDRGGRGHGPGGLGPGAWAGGWMSAAMPVELAVLTGRRSTVVYLTVLALGALDAAGYSLIAPVLPSLAHRLDAGPLVMGLLVATFPAGMAAGFALAGRLVRSGSPRVTLLAGLLLVGVGTVSFVAGGPLLVYAVGRTVMGLGSGCLWLGVTFATLVSWPGQEYVCTRR